MNTMELKDLEINSEILERRTNKMLSNTQPVVGDWVIFNDCERRISHIWKYDENAEVDPVTDWGIQTSSPHGSYYLGEGYVSFSGGLYMSIKGKLLEPTDTTKDAPVWFFNRDWSGAGRGVHFQTPFKVWIVNQDGPEI